MEATLIYNSNARSVTNIDVDALQEALYQAGYQPVYKATNHEKDLDAVLADASGLVVATGGDGTVRAVATRLINKPASLAILPMGTANNISRALGITAKPLDIIAGLSHPKKVRFDIGFVQGPWGEDYFLEGMGWGLFADALADYNPDEGKSIIRGITTAIRTVTDYETYPTEMWLDGKDISGDYILVEVLNTKAVGPRFQFAPDANPCDGLLDIIWVRNHKDDGLLDYAINMFNQDLEDLPSVERMRGKKLKVFWRNFPLHIDAEIQQNANKQIKNKSFAANVDGNPLQRDDSQVTVTIEVLPQAIELWLPEGVE